MDVTKFNLFFSILVGMITPFGGFMTFGTIGNLIGMLGYNVFYKEQYYFYYNRGINKTRLVSALFSVNFPIAVPIALLIFFES
ncbi:MAG: hypothetical protein HC831_05850 [Chloroflexia bacterium]|nr:hypothetical protein [Chloroflexia bacterium]